MKINYKNEISWHKSEDLRQGGIYLNKIIYYDYSLDSVQLANLNAIAQECPYSGGRSVYEARVFKQMLGDTTFYDDSLACYGLGYRISKNSNKPSNFFIKVYPNPSSESCIFNYRLPKDTPGKIEIYDILGNKIDVLGVNANSNNISYYSNNLVSGIYEVRLIGNKNVMGCGKMAIVK